MSETWDERRRALEDSYFEKQNQAAMDRLKKREQEKPRLSPITGEAMVQETIMGVVIDRCPRSGGIWLDGGELEQILTHSQSSEAKEGWLSQFIGSLKSKK